MRFRFDLKNFLLGAGAMFVLCLVPVVGSKVVELIGNFRNKINSK